MMPYHVTRSQKVRTFILLFPILLPGLLLHAIEALSEALHGGARWLRQWYGAYIGAPIGMWAMHTPLLRDVWLADIRERRAAAHRRRTAYRMLGRE